jgi:uncharacterized membrane protein YphA (DoxX/SURF4 family)
VTVIITWPVWNVRDEPVNLPLWTLPEVSFGWPVAISLLAALVWPRYGLAVHATVVGAACLWDQYRLQPQFISLLVLMSACIWPTATWLARWYLAAMWLWAGLHKFLSPEWYGFQSAHFLEQCGLPSDWHLALALVAAAGETALGITAALAPRRAAVACLVLHLGILLALSPLVRNFNGSVWPWNLATAVVGMWVLTQNVESPAGWPRVLAALFFVIPAGYFADLVNPHLAFVLYSGNLPRAVHVGRDTIRRIDGWAGLAVPFPDSPRLLVEYFRRTAVRGDKLHVADPRWGLPDRYYVKQPDGSVGEIPRRDFLDAAPSRGEVGGVELDDPNAVFWLRRFGVVLSGPSDDFVLAAAAGSQVSNRELWQISSLHNLRELRIEGASIADDALAAIAGLRRLEIFEMKTCSITDSGLVHLAGLDALRWLHLESMAVTERGLAVLESLPQLETLHLRATAIGNPTLERIGSLEQLDWLDLTDSKITGNLNELGRLKKLRWLNLSGTPLDDEDLPPLARLRGVEVVQLARTKITDAGLRHLERLHACQHLDLEATAITDDGLASLSSLAALRRLNLRGTQVTPAGIERLQQKLPDCVLEH